MISLEEMAKMDVLERDVMEEKILRYQKLDQQVFEIFRHNENSYDFYRECMKSEYQAPIRKRIQELETEVLKRDLQIESLKRENDVIWKTSIEKIAEEKLKVRDLEQRWGSLLGDK